MKKKALVIVLVCVLVLAVAGSYLSSHPLRTQMEHSISGCLIRTEGQVEPCTVTVEGAYCDYLLNNDVDSFNAGYDGGIWVNGDELDLKGIGFFEDSDYAVLVSQQGSYIANRTMSVFVANIELNGETVLVVAPAEGEADAVELLQRLYDESEPYDFEKIYGWFVPPGDS